MKILALIPARGGSKRLPGKNIKLLSGLPLIAWTIRAAQESGCCIDILVSTDDLAIAEVARQHGASVPWIRPSEFSTDSATSVDMAIHAINAYEIENGLIDGLLLLQPTSPFRSADSIKKAVALFTEGHASYPIVSVSPAISHPAWCFRAINMGIEPFLGWTALEQRSQDLEPAWMLNGSIYLITPVRLRADRTFLTRDVRPLLMDKPGESIDVDTSNDFELCELFLDRLKNTT